MKLDAWTISLQAVNFLVLAWLLHRFLYAPIQEVLARRKQELEEAKLRGEAAEAKAEEVRRALEAERSELAREREREMERVHAELERERSQRLEAAAADAAELAADTRKKLAAERELALDELRDEVSGLAVQLSERLLRALRSPALAEGALERLDAHLSNMKPEERAALGDALRREGGQLELAVAPALEPEARARWAARLLEHFEDAELQLSVDDELIAGAELRLPDARLRFSLRGSLDEALEELRDQPA